MNLQKITYEITYRCNLRCKYCFFWGEHIRTQNKKNILADHELSFNEIKDILLPQIEEAGVSMINLTGGEVLMRKDISDVIFLFRKSGLRLNIETNLSLNLSNRDRLLETLTENCQRVWVSIDGVEERHDLIRGAQGAFRQTISNLSYLSKRSARPEQVLVNCVVMPENQDSLSKIPPLLHSIGVNEIRYQLLTWDPLGQFNSSNPTATQSARNYSGLHGQPVSTLNGSMVYEQLMQAKDIAESLGMKIYFFPEVQFLSPRLIDSWYSGAYKGELWKNCPKLSTRVRIDPYGNIYPCMNYNFGNIREGTILSAWNSDLGRNFQNKVLKSGPLPGCVTCCKQEMKSIP